MKTLLLLAAPLFVSAPALSQGAMATPHESMKAFEKAVGHWEGSGTFGMPMSDQRMPWTCTLDFRKILDGFAYREVLEVDMGPVGRYHMMAVYAYDANRSVITQVKGDNYNGTSSALAQWIGDSLVTADARLTPQMDGSLQLGAERHVWSFAGDESTLDFTMCDGTHKAFNNVEGKLKRVSPESKPSSAALHGDSLAPGMEALAPLLGNWHMKGSMTMAPGMPKMNIFGDDRIWAMVGGQVMVAEVLGGAEGMDGFQYKAIGLTSWNAGARCWDHYAFTNMGDVMHSEWRAVKDGTIVMTHSGNYMGQAYAERGVYEFSADGPAKVWSDRFSGVSEGLRVFEGVYTPKKD